MTPTTEATPAFRLSAGHTEGPWLVSPFCARVEVPGADEPICELLWPTDLRSEDETFANARLIAAAPDLLAALQKLIDAATLRALRGRDHVLSMRAEQEAQSLARAAIAKATGAA